MENNSKKKEAFTLIEVIISMAIIAILSAGIYNGYLLIVKQTKGGEVKQQSSLIGKQIAEEIKAVYKEKDIEKKDGKIKLGNISLESDKKNSASYKGTVEFDKDGQVIGSDGTRQAKYEAEITMQSKTTFLKNDDKKQEEQIEIEDFSDSIEGYKAYIIKNSSEIKISDKVENSGNITEDVNLYIDINADNKLFLKNRYSKICYDPFNKDNNRLNLDLKYCKKNVRIEVNNKIKIPLNLYILNGDNENVNIVNQNGVLNEYYRSENDGIVGVLYEIRIKVYDKNKKDNTLYEANFVQNVDIQEIK